MANLDERREDLHHEDVPLSPAQRSRIRRLSKWEEPAPGEEAGELNIVPYLDIVMNIIVFIIATISVVFVTTIDSQAPSTGGGAKTRSVQAQALNLTALITSEGISLKTSGGNISTGCSGTGAGTAIPKKGDGTHDLEELRRCARVLKDANERFSEETQVTITANPDVEYQVLIDVMDHLRLDDPATCSKDEESKAWVGAGCLFPEVLFGVAR